MELVLDGEGRLQHVFCSDARRAINRLVKGDVTQSRAEALFVVSVEELARTMGAYHRTQDKYSPQALALIQKAKELSSDLRFGLGYFPNHLHGKSASYWRPELGGFLSKAAILLGGLISARVTASPRIHATASAPCVNTSARVDATASATRIDASGRVSATASIIPAAACIDASGRVSATASIIPAAPRIDASGRVSATASIISAAACVDASGCINTAPVRSSATSDNSPAVINASAGASDGCPSDGAIGNVKGKGAACYDASVRRGGRCASRSSYGDRCRGQHRQDDASHGTFLLFECHLPFLGTSKCKSRKRETQASRGRNSFAF